MSGYLACAVTSLPHPPRFNAKLLNPHGSALDRDVRL
jgi:hypothetical protein